MGFKCGAVVAPCSGGANGYYDGVKILSEKMLLWCGARGRGMNQKSGLHPALIEVMLPGALVTNKLLPKSNKSVLF